MWQQQALAGQFTSMALMLLARGQGLALWAEILSSAKAFLMAIPQTKQEERHFYLAIFRSDVVGK
jgi:hypothetical protein